MPNDMPSPVVLVPYGKDLLATAADHIIERCADRLPRLERVVVLLPDLQQGPALRRALTKAAAARGHSALLGPRIETIATLLADLCASTPAVISDHSRELILLDALRQHGDLFAQADLLQLARSLLELFDELALQRRTLPRDLDQFRRLLARAYGIEGDAPSHLSREAQIVHTLWLAWHQQLESEGVSDRTSWYLDLLAEGRDAVPPEWQVFAVGCVELRPTESAWLRALIQRQQADVILQGGLNGSGYHPDAPLHTLLHQLDVLTPQREHAASEPRTTALDAVFDLQRGNLGERAAALRNAFAASPLSGHLAIVAALDSEHEARAVELQVRRWLLEGKTRIGIVTEDRRLARRVRALLERAGIVLSDAGGWALSTTSSATVIERWLQAVEEDFSHQPLMDLLKSPFLLPDDADQAADYQHGIYRLEQDIILHENIPRGLDRFRRHLRYRQRRLGWSSQANTTVTALLDRLARASKPFASLVDAAPRPMHRYLAALMESLATLDVLGSLGRDEAGAQLIEQLERLQQAALDRSVDCDWITFRTWLGTALEHSHFHPPGANARVQLLSLQQSTLAHFDAVLLAAAEQEFLPGGTQVSPYFNDSVRRELGLQGWGQRLALRLHQFRRLLEAAPTVVLTHRREQDGEPVLASPWVEAIRALHQQAYGDELSDPVLIEWLRNPESEIASPDTAALPRPSPNPRVQLPASRLPQVLSAAAQQHLIDCPYQFFAADCLGLKPVEEVREALEKSDYGERVHRCLEAFHGGIEGLPGPFPGSLRADNRTEALTLLESIARAVFAQDLEDNFLHRGWLQRWLALIPAYVDWQLQREAHWRPSETERNLEQPLANDWRIRGRLDRIDRNAEGQCAIIDYKTGSLPSPVAVHTGEAVQLVSYAMLLDDATQVEYLQLNEQIRSVAVLGGEQLEQLQHGVRTRLVQVLEQIAAGASLPAWGDPDTCAYCPMSGLCRRQTWDGPVQ